MSEYISKTEMLIRLKCLAPKADDWNNCDEYNVAVSQYDYMFDYLKSIEPADVAPVVHGHWGDEISVREYDDVNGGYFITRVVPCSNCGYEIAAHNKTKFCPNCGAKMESEGEE